MSASVNLVRREVIETAETLVVKVGTNVISRPDLTLDLERIASLVDAVRRILETGRRVVVVSGRGLCGRVWSSLWFWVLCFWVFAWRFVRCSLLF